MTTPAKYIPEPRKYEDKAYLYEQYWGELRPTREIAADCGVCAQTIRRYMDQYGIPRRVDGYKRGNSVSPFAGFYAGQSARTDAESRTVFDPGHESQQDSDGFEWAFEDY